MAIKFIVEETDNEDLFPTGSEWIIVPQDFEGASVTVSISEIATEPPGGPPGSGPPGE